MNTWQIARQLQSLIRALTWDDGSTLLFQEHSVKVSSGVRDETVLEGMSPPYCFITPGAASVDPDGGGEEPELVRHDILVRVVTVHGADQFGEGVMIGANRDDHQDGAGAGILEIEEVLLNGIAKLTAENGIRIHVTNQSAVQAREVGESGMASARTYTLRCLTTLSRSYRAATGFTAADATGGDCNLSWTLPPSRYDYRRMILRRAAGATAPASATAGTGVTLGGSPDGVAAASVTDSPGAGQFSYSLWVAYDDFARSEDTTTTASGTATVTVT